MKRIEIILIIVFLAVMAIAFTACAHTKRDCRGTIHYKQKGGFYL